MVEALRTVLRLSDGPRLVVAGRTDAGVHARGQVAHVDVADGLPIEFARMVGQVRALLPDDVALHDLTVAPPGFDARFSALWRRYSYALNDGRGRCDPLRRHQVVAWSRPLDEDLMDRAGEQLLGEHDFSAFCRARPYASTVRTLQELSWSRTADGVLLARVRADAFCHHMVRALVGALVAVGEGRREVTWPALVLHAGRKDPGVRVMPGLGLVLEEVGYPDQPHFAHRATVTRARRRRAFGSAAGTDEPPAETPDPD